MKHRLSALALFPLIAVACAPAADVEADTAAIEAVREAEEAAATAGNVDAFMALIADDAMNMQPNGPPVVGADAIREWLEGFMETFTIEFNRYDTDEVIVSGDLAVERFSGVWTLTPTDGSDPVTETVKGLHVMQRQADGSWKITHDVWNTNEPLPGM